jgi:hypothetical protein
MANESGVATVAKTIGLAAVLGGACVNGEAGFIAFVEIFTVPAPFPFAATVLKTKQKAMATGNNDGWIFINRNVVSDWRGPDDSRGERCVWRDYLDGRKRYVASRELSQK